jgi:hypothetical protein
MNVTTLLRKGGFGYLYERQDQFFELVKREYLLHFFHVMFIIETSVVIMLIINKAHFKEYSMFLAYCNLQIEY